MKTRVRARRIGQGHFCPNTRTQTHRQHTQESFLSFHSLSLQIQWQNVLHPVSLLSKKKQSGFSVTLVWGEPKGGVQRETSFTFFFFYLLQHSFLTHSFTFFLLIHFTSFTTQSHNSSTRTTHTDSHIIEAQGNPYHKSEHTGQPTTDIK